MGGGGDCSPAAVAVAVLRDDLRPEVPEATPESYASLMVNCWDKDPTVRPKFLEIMTRLESFEEKSSTGWGGASTSSTMSGISGWGGGTSDKGSSSTGGSHSSNGTVCHACRVVPCRAVSCRVSCRRVVVCGAD